ncbi:MAG: alpha-ribazole phosphatase family protein [Proteobacteria bacterium]|nr:alpha-ribazole phosphatase family protein [Pseudomonadota bacterium]
MALIHLLRHGEPEGGKVFRGVTDDPLTETGWRQMHAQTRDQKWDRIISSPLCRCLDFGQRMHEEAGVDLFIEPALQEINFGDWEGCSAEALMTSDAERLRQFWQDPAAYPPPGGESMEDFRSRVLLAWTQICQTCNQARNKEENILVLSHGGVMRIIMQSLLALPWSSVFSINIGYGAVIRIQCTDTHVQWDGLLPAPE